MYRQLTVSRSERGDELAVILSGRAEPLRKLLGGNPPLAARFRAVIDFPGYAPGQLSAIFGALADEAGLRLTVAARGKAAAAWPRPPVRQRPAGGPAAEPGGRTSGAPHSDTTSRDPDLATLSTIAEADIPECLLPDGSPPDEDWPGQYP